MPSTRKPLTDLSRRLRRDTTDAEKRLWRPLREDPFKSAHFRRQVPIGRFVVDFASHSARLVVELDGGQHGMPNEADADASRSAFLRERGYKVLRFWNADVLANLEGVLDTISRALYDRDAMSGGRTAATPTPDPSPQGGGG